MSRLKTDLSRFDTGAEYSIGASKLKWILWFFANAIIVRNPMNPSYAIKRATLRKIHAKIGHSGTVKPGVNIKFPWKLEVGNYVWLGENVWIDNNEPIVIKDHTCLSQGAMLLTGNHDYKKVAFDYRGGTGVTLEEGVWIGAQAVVCPGVTVKSHAVLAVGSVAVSDLEPYTIYQGNPAQKVRERVIES